MECTVLSMVLCTIKNLWSDSIRVGHSPDFGLPSVAILPWLCRKRCKTIFTHHSINHYLNCFPFTNLVTITSGRFINTRTVSIYNSTSRPFGYERVYLPRVYLPRVYLPLYEVADTPFHIQGDDMSLAQHYKTSSEVAASGHATKRWKLVDIAPCHLTKHVLTH